MKLELYGLLLAEESLNGGSKGVGHFPLEVISVKETLIVLVRDVGHLHQNRRDVRGPQYNKIGQAIRGKFQLIHALNVIEEKLCKLEAPSHRIVLPEVKKDLVEVRILGEVGGF